MLRPPRSNKSYFLLLLTLHCGSTGWTAGSSAAAQAREAKGLREIRNGFAFAQLIDANAYREQEEHGEGFEYPFYPGNSSTFDPDKSKTFKVVPSEAFKLDYADNTHLKGFQGRDVLQIGDFFVEADFGAITDCNSPDFNGANMPASCCASCI